MALFRLAVYDEDMFGEPNFLGAATYPAAALLSGYRNTGRISFPTVNLGLTWGGCKHTCIGPTLIAIPIPIPYRTSNNTTIFGIFFHF